MAHEQNSNGHARNVSDFEMWNPEPMDSWVMPEDDMPLTLDELKARTRQVHVDQVRDMVPFWMKGVEAAQKGEVLRLEDFLEKLASEDRWGVADVDDPWGPSIGPWPADHPWAAAVPGGPADPWGKAADNPWGKVDDDPWGKIADWGMDEDSTLSIHVDRSVSHHKEDRRRIMTGGKGKGRKKQNRDHERRGRPDPHLFVEDIARQQSVNAERKRRMHDFYEVCINTPFLRNACSNDADAHPRQSEEDPGNGSLSSYCSCLSIFILARGDPLGGLLCFHPCSMVV